MIGYVETATQHSTISITRVFHATGYGTCIITTSVLKITGMGIISHGYVTGKIPVT